MALILSAINLQNLVQHIHVSFSLSAYTQQVQNLSQTNQE